MSKTNANPEVIETATGKPDCAPATGSGESAVREIIGYTLSDDYTQLAKLMKSQSIICTVKYITCRDVAHTTYYKSPISGEETFTLSARGIGYVHAWDHDDFLRQCAQSEVRFIPPNDPSSSTPP
jgi:hypothetical protein